MAKLNIPKTKELNLAFGNSMDSMKWMKAKVRSLRDMSPNDRRFMVGKLYCYCYDPKGKHELPYYDKFPLTLIVSYDREGFLGVNLHYLPPKMRYIFLNKLMSYAITNSDDEVVRYRISYELLQTVNRIKEYKPALKRYQYTHLRTKLVPVLYNEWQSILHLPFDHFMKEKKVNVWADSINELRS